MSKVLSNKETGEVIVIHTWRNPQPIVGRDYGVSHSIIQHHDFAYDPEIRGLKIIETEKEDRDAYIQSFADDCGVYNVLKKYSKTGDAALLNAKQGFYGDVSELPVDNLDPEAAKKAAAQALSGLNQSLGTELTAEQLSSMSADELNALIANAVQAAAAKAGEANKEGEGE